jgi:hypothetical protein
MKHLITAVAGITSSEIVFANINGILSTALQLTIGIITVYKLLKEKK